MSENIESIRAQLWEKMRDKSYRDTFVAAHLSTNIVAQIQTLRESRGWTKKELAKRTGMSPSRISVMEDPSYDKFTLSTLRRLASAFDVALITRFASFSGLVDWVANLSPDKLEVSEFEKDSLISLEKKLAGKIEVFDPTDKEPHQALKPVAIAQAPRKVEVLQHLPSWSETQNRTPSMFSASIVPRPEGAGLGVV